MDSVSLVVEKAKGVARSGQDFVSGLLQFREKSARRNPIQILKRLQRESFSDLMKLRDRQDKVERIISFYKTSSGSPFQEPSTHVRGEVDVLGAVLLLGDIDQEALEEAGIRTGISTKFAFQTTIRQKDTLVAEFMADQKGKRNYVDVSGSPLSLSKVFYVAKVSDWFSGIAIPVGARSRDIDIATHTSPQVKGLTNFSSFGPPLLNKHNGSSIGITARKSNIVASLAQSMSVLESQPGSDTTEHCFSTFAQVICQLPKGIKLSLLGLHQRSNFSTNHDNGIGPLAIPLRLTRRQNPHETSLETVASPPTGTLVSGSIALKVESELDEFTKLGGWIEMEKSNAKCMQWAINLSDNSEDESGWGMCVGGMTNGSKNLDRFQVESYLKVNMGNRFSVKPGVAYVSNGNGRTFALMLRSNWSL